MAFLIPLLVIIIGATISFGLFFFQANVLQQAVDVGAQEISRMPFSPTAELGLGDLNAVSTTVMYDAEFRSQIYDEQYLVIHDSEWDEDTPYNDDYQAYIDTLPLLNRLLAQVMVRDSTYPADGDPTTAVRRYPGAVVTYTDTEDQTMEETVLIPMLEYDSDTGAETLIRFVAPVEEIRIDHDEDPETRSIGPFSVVKPGAFARPGVEASFTPGMVALRINYPAHAPSLINRTGSTDDGRFVGVNVVDASGPAVGPNATTGSHYTLADNSDDLGPQSGTFGLGKGATPLFPNGVRPYRKVMSVQAIYRREVFE